MENEKKVFAFLLVGYIATIIWLSTCMASPSGGLLVCPTKFLWHIPCPGCGITRATILFLQGRIQASLKLNPNVLFSVLFLFVFPVVATLKILIMKPSVSIMYVRVESFLKKPVVFVLFLGFEMMVEIHNIINNI